jgi:hypothetical protein
MSNETKQTAVDKLESQIEKLRFQGVTEWQCGYQKALNEVLFLLKQAKEREEAQIINAYTQGQYDGDNIREEDAYEYYNLIYGGGEQ